MNKKQYLGSRDVAWILDLSPDDVVVLVKRKELQAIKIGRFWRFRFDDVQAYKKQRKKTKKTKKTK